MKTRTTLLVVTLGLASLAPALAGGAGAPIAQAQANPQTSGVTTAQTTNNADILAMEVSTMSNLTEILTSQLALQKSQNAAVRAYAQRMITEHTAAQQKLNAIAAAKNVKLTDKPGADQRLQYDKLSTLTGAEFDKMYVMVQVMGHDMTLKLLDTYLTIGKDPQGLAYAREIRPAVAMHLRDAQAIQQQLGQ
ncbi:DUF4142 domain-containing protein [Deinococcus pimensis]|uniref:DUF4142 domain-containing protein n=1 Tax=Deinococcus pimensis TaxID=309888 RepID=UPI000481D8F6|nr:DUF4142 domain-containing protein [Deinococcus pimensis]